MDLNGKHGVRDCVFNKNFLSATQTLHKHMETQKRPARIRTRTRSAAPTHGTPTVLIERSLVVTPSHAHPIPGSSSHSPLRSILLIRCAVAPHPTPLRAPSEAGS